MACILLQVLVGFVVNHLPVSIAQLLKVLRKARDIPFEEPCCQLSSINIELGDAAVESCLSPWHPGANGWIQAAHDLH